MYKAVLVSAEEFAFNSIFSKLSFFVVPDFHVGKKVSSIQSEKSMSLPYYFLHLDLDT